MADLTDRAIAGYVAHLLDLEDAVESAQTDKREFFASTRDAHGRDFVDALKKAVKVANMLPEKRLKAEEIDAQAERILEIMRKGLHVARGARTREDVPHDADGVVLDDEIPAAILPAQSYGVDPERTAGAAVEDETAQDHQMHERASTDDEPSPEAGPQAQAFHSQGTGAGTLADREARHEGEAVSADLPTNPAPVTQETADSDGSGATPALVATNSGQPSPDNDRSRGATSSLNSTPAPVDRSKPNPWCMDPDECGVEASWDYFCLKCQAVKKGREAAGAALQ